MVASGPPSASESTASMGALLLPLQLSGEFLEWAVLFAVLALVAWLVGARGLADTSATVAKWLVILFVVLALISLLL